MSSESNSSNTPTHEQISVRARQLWENAGSPADRDLEFWLEAEGGLRREAQESRPRASNGMTEPAIKQPQSSQSSRSGSRRR